LLCVGKSAIEWPRVTLGRDGDRGRNRILEAEAILLLHQRNPRGTPVVMKESADAFVRHSRFPVWSINTYFGLPEGLARCRFRAIVLHYSLFYGDFAPLRAGPLAVLAGNPGAYRIAMFQDEQAYLPERIDFCRRYGIDCVYSTLGVDDAKRIYGSSAGEVVSYLPGLVSARLRAAAGRLAGTTAVRAIDIGYRGRRLPADWGEGAREKEEIATKFLDRVKDLDLTLDIEVDEDKRVYGRAWEAFVASCKAMLGTESGTGVLPWIVASSNRGSPRLQRYGGGAVPPGWRTIPYGTLAPRHLEAAAFGTCQILYLGGYSGLLEPWRHYIPLAKDFSNFDEVIAAFRDGRLRAEIAAAVKRDLIDADALTYATMVSEFDLLLERAGAAPRPRPFERTRVVAVATRPYFRTASRFAKKALWVYVAPLQRLTS